MGTKLNTAQAAQYLSERGKPTKESALNTLRSTGGGPLFEKEDGKKTILYDSDDLDEWNTPSPVKKYRSTSEYSNRKKTPKPNGTPPEDKPSDPTPDDGEAE
jgi:hypothetical protein